MSDRETLQDLANYFDQTKMKDLNDLSLYITDVLVYNGDMEVIDGVLVAIYKEQSAHNILKGLAEFIEPTDKNNLAMNVLTGDDLAWPALCDKLKEEEFFHEKTLEQLASLRRHVEFDFTVYLCRRPDESLYLDIKVQAGREVLAAFSGGYQFDYGICLSDNGWRGLKEIQGQIWVEQEDEHGSPWEFGGDRLREAIWAVVEREIIVKPSLPNFFPVEVNWAREVPQERPNIIFTYNPETRKWQ